MRTGVSKKEFIAKYAELLCMTRENVVDLSLIDNDTVEIVYCDARKELYYQKVNIACDSGMAIIRDVAKAID